MITPVAFGGNNTAGPIDVATARNEHSGPSGRLDFESETFIATAHVAPSLRAQAQAQASHRADSDVYIAHALRADGFDASEDGTGRGTPLVASRVMGFQGRASSSQSMNPSEISPALDIGKAGGVPICFSAKDHGADAASDVSPTLRAGGHDKSHANAGVMPAVMYSIMPMNSGKDYKAREVDVAQPLMASGPTTGNQGGDVLVQNVAASVTWAVRRLMPVECEKLQGQPDGHTLVDYRGKPAADGPRYKAIGNSFPVPVIRRIGERIALVDQL